MRSFRQHDGTFLLLGKRGLQLRDLSLFLLFFCVKSQFKLFLHWNVAFPESKAVLFFFFSHFSNSSSFFWRELDSPFSIVWSLKKPKVIESLIDVNEERERERNGIFRQFDGSDVSSGVKLVYRLQFYSQEERPQACWC